MFKGTERFTVQAQLGTGGMGSVYRVVDRVRRRTLALKSVGRVDGDRLWRFKQEFRSLQGFDHPGVVSLGELFERNGEWFFTMELVEGTELREHLWGLPAGTMTSNALSTTWSELDEVKSGIIGFPKNPSFEPQRLRVSLLQLADAMHALHRYGHVHRDIKPSNVLVEKTGRIVLIDFGLVLSMGERVDSPGSLIGTVAYMSPEQAIGGEVGPASDWYAFGVTLFELMTGCPPFIGEPLDVLLRKQSEVAGSPRDLVPHLPDDLVGLCERLLHVDPKQRPTGDDVLASLRGAAPKVARVRKDQLGTVFVGREVELARLEHALAGVEAKTPQMVAVMGPSGIGKTSLIERFAGRACMRDPALLVFRGRCFEQETVPFKAFDAVMDQVAHWLASLPRSERLAYLPTRPRRLALAFPVLSRIAELQDGLTPLAIDPVQLRRDVFDAIHELFGKIASRQPLLLMIDDVQWSDEDSRHLMAVLLYEPEPIGLMVLCTEVAQDEQSERVAEWLPGIQRLRLGELSVRESAALLRKRGYQGAIATILEQAQGHPLLLELPLRAAGNDAGFVGDMMFALHRQIESLEAPARRYLEVVCIAGFPIASVLAADVAHVDRPLRVERNLRVARLTRAADGEDRWIEAYHSSIAVAVVASMPPLERAQRHRQLGYALAATGASPHRIAVHLAAGESPPEAVPYFIEAARQAMAGLAFEQGVEFYTRALHVSLDERLNRTIRYELGSALASAGRAEDAAQTFEHMLPYADEATRHVLRRRIAEQRLTAGLYKEGLQAAREALEPFGMNVPSSPVASLRQLAVLRARVWMRGLRVEPRCPREDEHEVLARFDVCWSLARGLVSHDVIMGQVFQTRALLFALQTPEPIRLAKALCFEYLSRAIDGPKALSEQRWMLSRAAEIAEASGDPAAQATVAFADGMGLHTAACDFRDSAPRFEEAGAILRSQCVDVAWEAALCDEQRMIDYYWLGRWAELSREIPELCQHAQAIGHRYWVNRFMGSYLSFAAEIRGDVDESRRLIALGEAALPSDASTVQRFGQMWCWTRVDLYDGLWARALARLQGFHTDLLGSLILKVPLLTLTNQFDIARVRLAAATHEAVHRAYHLREARRSASRLARLDVAFASGLVELIEGAAAQIEGDLSQAEERWARAESTLRDHQLDALVAALRCRRGALIGGVAGEQLERAGLSFYRVQSVADPQAMNRMLLPCRE